MSIQLYADEACTQAVNVSFAFQQEDALDPGTYKDYRSVLVLDAATSLYRLTGGVYTLLQESVHYSKAGDVVSLDSGLGPAEQLIVSPASALSLNIGGTAGAVVVKERKFYLKRNGEMTYSNLHVFSDDIADTTAVRLEFADVTFVDGTGSGLESFDFSAAVGCAAFANSDFVGFVTGGSATTVTIDNLTYDATSVVLQIRSVGGLEFAPDVAGVAGTYASVLPIADITNDTAVAVWVRESMTIPGSPVAYPNLQITISGVEYL